MGRNRRGRNEERPRLTNQQIRKEGVWDLDIVCERLGRGSTGVASIHDDFIANTDRSRHIKTRLGKAKV